MMEPIRLIPLIIATLGLVFASFIKKKEWVIVTFVVWIVIFVLTFFVFK